MNRKLFISAVAILCAVPLLSGCYKREPIYSGVSEYAVRFDIDAGSVLYMMPKELGLIQLSLYDPATGKEVYKTFLDKEGGYLYSVKPGTYSAAAWTRNADNTFVTYTTDYNLLTAETKVVQETPMKVIVAPDHVFAYSAQELTVPYVTEADKDVVFTLPMRSVIDTWRVEVDGVEGLTNFSDANFFFSNQTREVYFKDWKREGVAAVRSRGRVEGGLVVSELGTFGMPENGLVSVIVRILAQNGYVHETTVDVTDQVMDPTNTRHIIKIHYETVLKPLEQGGLQPTAQEWNEHIDIIELK